MAACKQVHKVPAERFHCRRRGVLKLEVWSGSDWEAKEQPTLIG